MRRASVRFALATSVVALTAALGQGPVGAQPRLIQPEPVNPALSNPPPPANPAEHSKPCSEPPGRGDGMFSNAALETMNFPSVWHITRGAGQKVAVIDTGVSPHPRLPGLNIGDSSDLVMPGDRGISDCDGHGTLVAGLIAGQPRDGSAFHGGAPDAEIFSIRQTTSRFREKGRTDNVDPVTGITKDGYGNLHTIATAIRQAADKGATVINISIAACLGANESINGDAYIGAALQYAVDVHDVVVVVAAGNSSEGSCNTNPYVNPVNPSTSPWSPGQVRTIVTPAWYDDYVLTVGAVNADSGAAADFTIAGPWVDVAAPGTDIISLSPSDDGLTNHTLNAGANEYQPTQGTSFAAPLVAATAALVRASHPELNARQVMDRIKATAHGAGEARSPVLGYGTVDPLAAVTADISPNALSVTHYKSEQIDALPPEPEPDLRPRNTALAGVGILAAVFTLGVLGSFPLRRWRQSRT
ncbi:MAG: type VII secretion-associated serine protease mycosin [Rhodococcus sp.]|nr:type VII secretion-associated serine protease mycosin [Rhodococcus sp. (in: high G+C Gram-positive bacteria)]